MSTLDDSTANLVNEITALTKKIESIQEIHKDKIFRLDFEQSRELSDFDQRLPIEEDIHKLRIEYELSLIAEFEALVGVKYEEACNAPLKYMVHNERLIDIDLTMINWKPFMVKNHRELVELEMWDNIGINHPFYGPKKVIGVYFSILTEIMLGFEKCLIPRSEMYEGDQIEITTIYFFSGSRDCIGIL